MEHTILVAYATERGSTEEVAVIAEELAGRGVEVQQRPAGARGRNAIGAGAGEVADLLRAAAP